MVTCQLMAGTIKKVLNIVVINFEYVVKSKCNYMYIVKHTYSHYSKI